MSALGWGAIALYLIGVIGFSAMGRDLSTAPRTWRTRVNLGLWPITVTWGALGDLWDRAGDWLHDLD